ncbi:ArsR/SmtB family transcription factor [Corynebacterium epidermidicanis]|uniref:Putative transcriptional regulator n=1 Tax=Corynebacterium epidermidicanis TaxID=1050174 RepID=A0A0G3GXR5_9CORY|nr:MarR family transcriptional regulator [Corynebacterium epidermidicanis]AKK04323.1 putative transcriptional regulator [Corynebacterium epidermidicanis]
MTGDPTQERQLPDARETPLPLADEWSPIFKLLGDPSRLRLLLAMHYCGPANATVSELAELTSLRTATASAALKHMEANGVVAAVRSGREVRYRLISAPVHELLHHLGGTHRH